MTCFLTVEWRELSSSLLRIPFDEANSRILKFWETHRTLIDLADINQQLRNQNVRFFLFPAIYREAVGAECIAFSRDPSSTTVPAAHRIWCSTKPQTDRASSLPWDHHRYLSWSIDQSELIPGSHDYDRAQLLLRNTGVPVISSRFDEPSGLRATMIGMMTDVQQSKHKRMHLLKQEQFDAFCELMQKDITLRRRAFQSGIIFSHTLGKNSGWDRQVSVPNDMLELKYSLRITTTLPSGLSVVRVHSAN